MGWDVDEFLRSLNDLAESTVKAYSNDLGEFVGWASRRGLDGPEGVDRLVLRRYLAFMATAGRSRRTIARRASALRR